MRDLVAVVTGGSGGIGRGAAEALSREGYAVVLLGRNAELLSRTAEELSIEGRQVDFVEADVTDRDTISTALGRVERINVLVNAAGVNVPQAFLEVDPTTLASIVETNLYGTFYTSQVAVERMIAGGDGGAIVNISSQMGHVGGPMRAAYCASKHAVEGLTKAMAIELAEHKIRVNSVAPTYIITPMTKPFFEDPVFLADSVARIPLGRIGEIEDVLGAIMYLVSPAASLVTGTSIVIDGGYTAQ